MIIYYIEMLKSLLNHIDIYNPAQQDMDKDDPINSKFKELT